MKNELTFLTVAFMALSANAAKSPYQDMNYSDWGKLQLVGNQLSSKDGEPVQLKGWSTDHILSDNVDGCLGQGQFEMMKSYGANVVRLPLNVSDSLRGKTYLSDVEFSKEQIKMFVAEAYAQNIYVVVAWDDSDNDGNGTLDLKKNQSEAEDFFAEISKYCADNGYDNVLYELCNEPNCGWASIKSYTEEVIPVITANQPDAIIIVDTDAWCQKIMEPVTRPIDSKYKKNVMYSFHYYACSHFNLIGDFRNAQSKIPVFVSEWTANKYNGSGPFCSRNADALIAYCDKTESTPQVVSWCVWNWGKKDDACSFFTGDCGNQSISTYPGDNGQKYGNYILSLMRPSSYCCPPPPCCGPIPNKNKIPTTENSLFHWDEFDYGGEGISYHDENSSAWVKDSTGAVIGYRNDGDEVDVYSLAHKMQWLDKDCPWSTVEDGSVIQFDESINTEWTNYDGNPSYRSLNGGKKYYGTDGSARPDEGVDLLGASCLGTAYANSGYTCLSLVEAGEWINYTVDVEKPGYYKIRGLVSSDYKPSKIDGEIAIKSEYGNILRSSKNIVDNKLVESFGFPKVSKCADSSKELTEPWDCWAESDAVSGDYEEVLVVFPKSGDNSIQIQFVGDASGVGPLMFDFYKDLPDDLINCCDDVPEGGVLGAVDDVENANVSIIPNPTSGEFTVSLANDAEAVVEVVNMAGQVVASQIVDGTATINKTLTPGVYTVVVKSEGAVGTQKLMVK